MMKLKKNIPNSLMIKIKIQRKEINNQRIIKTQKKKKIKIKMLIKIKNKNIDMILQQKNKESMKNNLRRYALKKLDCA